MVKFTDELEQWVQEREKKYKKKRQDKFAVEFLAVKKNIIEAIDAGYSLKTIWEYLKESRKVTSTYETFRRHVKRFIKLESKNYKILAAKNEVLTANLETEEQKKPQLQGIGGFKFDAKPNKEDLI